MAYKRELIINNGSLTSYKKLLKVSDVCQLLDKSKYSATQTINGVTFTNNGDGTITYNGVTSVGANYILQSGLKVVSGHKYFSCVGENIGDKISVLLYANEDPYNTFDNRFPNADGEIVTALKNSDELYYQPKPHHNISFSNFVLKPQLFDLTEMYGAGNEPTTVAEFKAKFPNELYDYSPRCWVKSYKTGLIAKTKNLFNINALTPYTPETLPTNTVGVCNGNIIARAGVGSSVCQSGKTLKQLCPDLVAGEMYVLSYKTNATTGGVQNIYLLEEERYWQNGYPITITETSLNSIVCFYANYPDLTVATISNFQIEKGSVATDYVPYGYL